jgi:hypothetical protein
LVTGVCGHRGEEALPINDRPVDLARSDELPRAVDRLYVEGQMAPATPRDGVAVISTLPPTGVARRCLYERSLSLAQYFPLTGDFWRSRRHARSSIALTATSH